MERGDGRVLGGVIFRYEVLFVKNVFFFVTSTFFLRFFALSSRSRNMGRKLTKTCTAPGNPANVPVRYRIAAALFPQFTAASSTFFRLLLSRILPVHGRGQEIPPIPGGTSAELGEGAMIGGTNRHTRLLPGKFS